MTNAKFMATMTKPRKNWPLVFFVSFVSNFICVLYLVPKFLSRVLVNIITDIKTGKSTTCR